MTQSSRARGLLLASAGAIAFSGKAIIVKLAYRHGVDAVTVLMYRMLFSLPMFLGADATRASWHAFFIVFAWVFAIGGVILGYYAAAKYVPAASAALREGRASRAVVEVGS